MKIRIKRVKRGTVYEANRLDKAFVNASISLVPEIGEHMWMLFDHIRWGTWQTTPVIDIQYVKSTMVVITENSIYHVKLGWGKT